MCRIVGRGEKKIVVEVEMCIEFWAFLGILTRAFLS